MKNDKDKKTFDSIAFKRDTQARIYEDVKDLSPEDEIAYFKKAAVAGRLGKWWRIVSKEEFAD